MTSRLTLPLVPLLALSPVAAAGGQESPDVRELFVRNCAACHGEKGDGQGVTDLDRKARSFKDGGFSYGNTPETVQRTIRSGIPGTPMPAFGEAFEASQVEALALYVIELGPGLPPPPENTELVVKGRPVIVRGLLPPIAEGTQNQTRGLLVGLPDGFTFEYRTDDVRLLGVRQGRFVDRTDWIGRGGTPLAPLGRVVALMDGGEPGATFASVDGAQLAPLVARFRGTSVLEDGGELRYDLVEATGATRASVREWVKTIPLAIGAGLRRDFLLTGGATDLPLALVEFRPDEAEEVTFFSRGYETRWREVDANTVELLGWIRYDRLEDGIPKLPSQEEGELLLPAGSRSLLSTLRVRMARQDAEELQHDVFVKAVDKGLDFWGQR